jgi:hypothetical protein
MIDILYIDPEARLEGVRRRLAQLRGSARVRQVVLDVPEGWLELDNTARMRLLQRQAQFQRCELGLITRNEATRKAAREVGIPVFVHAEDAKKRHWSMEPLLPLVDPRNPSAGLPEPPPWRNTGTWRNTGMSQVVKQMARPDLHQARQQRIRSEVRHRRPSPIWLRWIGVGFMGLFIGLLLLGFTFYILPAATITLTPGRETVSVTVPLIANPDLALADLEIGQLPARLIETTIEVTGTIPTTGVAQRASGRAQGAVVFSNLGSTGVNIPVGTVVSTATGTPVSFRTVAPAELPGGVGQQVTVPIEALEEGTLGNVRANTITDVEGAMRFRVRVINSGGTGGGGSELTPVVTQQDRDNLLAQLQQVAQARAVAALEPQLEAGEWLPPETVQTLIIAQDFNALNDEETTTLGLTLRSLVRGVVVNEEETRAALLNAVQQEIPERGRLVADSFVAQRVPGAAPLGSSVQFTMMVSADYIVPIDPADVRTIAAGQPPEAAIAALQARWPLERSPEIHRDPEWISTLPPLGRRIQVRVDYGDTESTEDAQSARSLSRFSSVRSV